MPDIGSTELTYLWLSAILGVVHIVAAASASVMSRGLPWAMGPRDETPPAGVVAARLDRASRNFLETFPLFAAAVLVYAVSGLPPHTHTGTLAALGVQLYFWGRLIYLPVYAIGLPVVRTLVWTIAVVGLLLVLWACLPG